MDPTDPTDVNDNPDAIENTDVIPLAIPEWGDRGPLLQHAAQACALWGGRAIPIVPHVELRPRALPGTRAARGTSRGSRREKFRLDIPYDRQEMTGEGDDREALRGWINANWAQLVELGQHSYYAGSSAYPGEARSYTDGVYGMSACAQGGYVYVAAWRLRAG